MPAPSDLALLTDAALEAGEIACRYFRADPQVWEKGEGAGPVTEADLAVNDMLHQRLLDARPGYGWLSEETDDDPARLDQETVFIIDPIDGTRAFVEGGKHWGHSLAIAHKGEITAAVVFMPVIEQLYTASQGQGAMANGAPMQISPRRHITGATVLANKANFAADYWPYGQPDMKRTFRSSLAYRLALVAEGAFDAMLTLRPTWEWDIAAGALLVAEAGGHMTSQVGEEITFNTASAKAAGVLAGPQALTRALKDALSGPGGG